MSKQAKVPGSTSGVRPDTDPVRAKRRLRGRTKALKRSTLRDGRPGEQKRELTQEQRSDLFRKSQRAKELRELADAARDRHHNIDVWHAEERKKIEAKYR